MRNPLVRFSTLAVLLSVPLAAQAVEPSAYGEASAKAGGLLYDNWPKLTNFASDKNHPLYPADAKKNGTDTWRCKECHGWDYIGAEGRYRSGSHFTGIGGVYDARNTLPPKLFGALGGDLPGHDFSAVLSDSDRWNLVRFLREGVTDTKAFIRTDGAATGNAGRGEPLYAAHCSACHGAEGLSKDFKGKMEGVQGVGWAARDNPQETLHKIRWGHPGTKMPSAVADKGLTDAQVADLLAHAQTLP